MRRMVSGGFKSGCESEEGRKRKEKEKGREVLTALSDSICLAVNG